MADRAEQSEALFLRPLPVRPQQRGAASVGGEQPDAPVAGNHEFAERRVAAPGEQCRRRGVGGRSAAPGAEPGGSQEHRPSPDHGGCVPVTE
jgi:hypothetical protein